MPMTREQYEAKREARYQRLVDAAERAQRESNAAHTQARQMADVIPFGQPILVGHYSEGRDRRYRARIDNKFRKGFELQEKAEYYRSRAQAMESNTAIFSDDPDAAEKIADKIARLEKRQETMREANKLVRKGDRAGLVAMGYTDATIDAFFKGDILGRRGYADFQLTNNSANIRRLKQRAQVIEKHAQDETTEKEINGIRIVDNVEDNRLQMFFPGKPSEEVRKALKSRGFRWTPSAGCWQAYRGNHSKWAAEDIVKMVPNL